MPEENNSMGLLRRQGEGMSTVLPGRIPRPVWKKKMGYYGINVSGLKNPTAPKVDSPKLKQYEKIPSIIPMWERSVGPKSSSKVPLPHAGSIVIVRF